MDEDQSRKMLKERYIDFGPTQAYGSFQSTLINALPVWAKLSSDSVQAHTYKHILFKHTFVAMHTACNVYI